MGLLLLPGAAEWPLLSDGSLFKAANFISAFLIIAHRALCCAIIRNTRCAIIRDTCLLRSMLSLSPAWRRTGQLWLGLLRASAGTAPSVRRDLYVSHEWSRRFSSAAATDPSHSSSASAEHVTTASGKYLSRHVRGVKRWEEAKEKATEEEIDFGTWRYSVHRVMY